MKRRLFIALPLSEEAHAEIERVFERVSGQISRKFRSIPIEYRHVTLLFLGDQDESAIPGIQAAIRGVVSRVNAPVFVKFERIHYGPDDRQARMIWVSGDGNSSKTLSVLKDMLAEAFRENGIVWDEDRRAFHAHITLARLSSNSARFAGISDAQKSISEGALHIGWRCSTLDLMESILTPQGANYRCVDRIALP